MEFWVANKAIVIAIGALLFNVVVWGIFALKQRTENARIAALESEIRNLKQKQKQQESRSPLQQVTSPVIKIQGE